MITLGSNGDEVKKLQTFLGITADGIFGIETFATVKNWQIKNGLTPDGIVGPKTLSAMGLLDTNITETNQYFEKKYLDKDEYFAGPTKKQWIFIHHTAGWHNPYNVVSDWNNDTRGKIATEFVIGGQSIKADDEKYDGTIVQSMPQGSYAWHLGIGNCALHYNSVGNSFTMY
jgi:lysozyme family protein